MILFISLYKKSTPKNINEVSLMCGIISPIIKNIAAAIYLTFTLFFNGGAICSCKS